MTSPRTCRGCGRKRPFECPEDLCRYWKYPRKGCSDRWLDWVVANVQTDVLISDSDVCKALVDRWLELGKP